MPLTEITQDMRDEMLSGKLGEDIPIMKRMVMIYGGQMPVSKIKPLTPKQKRMHLTGGLKPTKEPLVNTSKKESKGYGCPGRYKGHGPDH